MNEEELSKEALISRLKKIEDSRDCESILTQLTAVRSAIESAGALLLNNYLKFCFAKGRDKEPADIDSLARALAIWGRVRLGD
jgi:DNA-binding FrmR family transcriptional regulator